MYWYKLYMSKLMVLRNKCKYYNVNATQTATPHKQKKKKKKKKKKKEKRLTCMLAAKT